jgi:SAM-dependent methyltransferase
MASSPAVSQPPSPEATMNFAFRVVGDLAAAMNGPLFYIGDRLGIFKALADSGPITCHQLAQRTGLNERYLREWLSAMTAAQYLIYTPEGQTFTMPPENAAVLARDDSPFFVGGLAQMIPDHYRILPDTMYSFQHGGGVPYSSFGEDTFIGTERLFRTGYLNFLAQQWIPAMPDVAGKLESGAHVADVGCGRGQALLILAKAFPNSTFVGYDNFVPGIDYANQNASKESLSDRLHFEVCSANTLPQSGDFDLVMTGDCLHDMVSPEACARSIHGMLKPDGTWFCIEPNLRDRLEENVGPIPKLFYSVSTMQCMSCSLAHGGAGYGAGMGEGNVHRIAQLAGFTQFRRLAIDNPFNQLFEIRK